VIRLLEQGEETAQAALRARRELEARYLERFGWMPPKRILDKWYPLRLDVK